ncbi:MAG: hypothetical protein AB7P00_39645, partial [Sandaracinaceae bacterium]
MAIDVGVTPVIEPVEGYERDGEWYVASKDRADLALFAHPVPRPFGIRDQLRVDLKARPTQIAYSVLLGLFVGGFILSQWWMSIFAVFGVLFLARSFLGQIRQMRHGVLSTARIVEIQHDWGPGAANEGVMVDGRPMNVSLDPRILRAF